MTNNATATGFVISLTQRIGLGYHKRMTLTEQAHQLLQQSHCRRGLLIGGRRTAGAGLLLMPLAAASSAATAQFSDPAFAATNQSPDGNGFDPSNSMPISMVLDNGHQLKIYGPLDSTITSGSNFVTDFSFIGNWNVAPDAGDLFQISYDATVSASARVGVANLAWTYEIDLNNDGTAEYAASGGGGGSGGSLSLMADGTASIVAPASGASKYRIDLIISCSYSGQTADEHADIPMNSLDFLAVPEPGTNALFLLGTLAALASLCWRKLGRRRQS